MELRTHLATASVLALALLASPIATPLSATRAQAATSAEVQMARYVNNARSASGARSLALTSTLTTVARRHTWRMARAGAIFHNANLPNEVSGWRYLGEDVGRGATVWRVYKGFMASPTHRREILYGNYSRFGVGIVFSRGYAWVTLVFFG